LSVARAAAVALAAGFGLACAAYYGEGSRPSALGSALLCAFVLLCAPSVAREPRRSGSRAWLPWPVAVVWCAPPLVLAASIDVARGADAAAVWTSLAAGVAMLGTWSALWGRRGASIAGGAALAAPALGLALDWVGAGSGGGLGSALAATSPLGFCHALLVGLGEGRAPGIWPPLLASLVIASLLGLAPRARSALAATLVLCVLCPTSRSGEERLLPARIELVGPLERVTADCAGAGRITIEARLGVGERRVVELGLPVASRAARDLDPGSPTFVAQGQGSVRLLEWVDDAAARASFAAVGPGLLARPRPVPERARPRPTAAAWLATAAALAAGLALCRRSRSWAAAPAALWTAALALPGARPLWIESPSGRVVEVLELDLGAASGARALRLRSGAGAVSLRMGPARVEVRPPQAPLEVEVQLVPGAPAAVRLRAPGGWVDVLESVPLSGPAAALGDRDPAAIEALLGALGAGGAGAALRGTDGDWDWGPAGARGGGGLPAWCVEGLPAGREVGVLAPGPGRAWARWVR
jgi:hypothetical protein